MIRVLIADDHAIVRAGFRQFIAGESDMEVVAEADSGRAALDIARKKLCDVILLDINMPGQNGVDTLRAIKEGQPEMPILILSGYPEHQYALSMFKIGANGYLRKDCEPAELIKAIRTVANGRKYISPTVGEILAETIDAPSDAPIHTQLSDREFQVFCRLAKGESVSHIAEALFLSVKTVSTYRTRVLEKMHLQSNSDLTYYALKAGLLD